MHRCCVYQICIFTLGIFFVLFCAFGRSIFASYSCFTTRPLQYPDWCCFQKVKDGSKYYAVRKGTKNLPTPNSPHTSDVSSAVHVHVIRNALEARQATALNIKTTIVCSFVFTVRRPLPEKSKDKIRAYLLLPSSDVVRKCLHKRQGHNVMILEGWVALSWKGRFTHADAIRD